MFLQSFTGLNRIFTHQDTHTAELDSNRRKGALVDAIRRAHVPCVAGLCRWR